MTRARGLGSALASIRVLQRRDWLSLVIVVLVAALVAVLAYVVVDAGQARRDAARVVDAQAEQSIDVREAQSSRITQLLEQVEEMQAELDEQNALLGRQEQAIADLAAQVDQLGGKPVAGHVAPTPPDDEEP